MYTYRAKLVRVIDGDTVELDIDVGFYLTARVRCRLAVINTPERGQPGYAEAITEINRLLADAAHDGWLNIATGKSDKYGRWLVTIAAGEHDTVNQLLMAGGFAKSYA